MHFRSHVQDQGELFPPRLGELIPQDDLCRVVSEVVDRLDLSAFSANYSMLGQEAFSPSTMLKLAFLGYAEGVRSSRALEKAVKFDVRYMWICGQDRPRKSAIAEFRRRNLALIENLFVQIVRLCIELGMVQFGRWAIDGTRIKANAGKGSRKREAALQAELDKVRSEIRNSLAEAEVADSGDDDDPLPPELRRKEDRSKRLDQALRKIRQGASHASTTDPDAPTMKRKGGGFEPAYNPQLTVDSESQVVLASDVCTAQRDSAQLIPQIEQARQNTSKQPAQVCADSDYASTTNFVALAERGIEGFIPMNPSVQKRHMREEFKYDAARDVVVCPAGRDLEYVRKRLKERESGNFYARVFVSRSCEDCTLAPDCLHKGTKRRRIEICEHEHLLEAMRKRCRDPEGLEAYKKRKQSVEPAFGVIKAVMGFRSFLLRGLSRVKAEWQLACSAFNIRKIWKFKSASPQSA